MIKTSLNSKLNSTIVLGLEMNNKFFRLGTAIIGATLIGLVPISAIAEYPKIAQNLTASEQLTLTKEIASKKSKLILAQNEADYNRAIQLNPNDAQAYYNRGLIRYEQKNYPGAEADFSQAIGINPLDEQAYYNRGLTRYRLKNYPGAEADFSQAIGVNSELAAQSYHNRGLVRYEQKNYPGAEADYTQAIRINPKYAAAYNNRGFARYKASNIPDAIADLQTAAQLFRKQGNPEAYQQVQQALTQLQALPSQ